MYNTNDELNQMLDQIPVYASWKVIELEIVFIRFREITLKMKEPDKYDKQEWFDSCFPNLQGRIKGMLLEKNFEKQNRHYNNIIFDLRCAIETLM